MYNVIKYFIIINFKNLKPFFTSRGSGGRNCMVVGFPTTYMQSVPITTNVVSLNPAQAMCTGTRYNIM